MKTTDYEEIAYPVKEYASHLKEDHARNTSELFEELVRKSGVDAEANAVLVKEIRKKENLLATLKSWLGIWRFLRNLLVLVAIAGIAVGVLYLLPMVWDEAPKLDITPEVAGGSGIAAALALLLIFTVMRSKIRALQAAADESQEQLDELIRRATAQMQPLTDLFQWDTVASLVMKTLPIVKIDRYFTHERLDSLCRHFNWQPDSENNVSIVGCQSGTLNGNPWVIADTFRQEWGTEIYYGSLQISWSERVSYTDSQGRTQYRWEKRYETLTASVEKPKPVYDRIKYLIYGNEAAPKLTFSRDPNPLSDSGQGFFGRRKLKSAIAALEKNSRDMSTSFTIMDNREFDACFNAVDRSDELEFRLLFTPLAQQEMLALLRDKKHGYGDDFRFLKRKMVNYIIPEHLRETDVSASPHQFIHYDLEMIRRNFNSCSNEFFRAFYFSMAPLLSIPLYQQHRNFPDIYEGILDKGEPSQFEYESLANAFDEKAFKPEQAVTPCILKTATVRHEETAAQLSVTAYAYRTEPRLTYVSKYGGDGRWHDVPVHWKEYLPVRRTTPMAVCETGTNDAHEFRTRCRQEEWQAFFRSWYGSPDSRIHFRRTLAAFLQTDK
ncbi:MAG: hypothetical protein IJS14_04190 [Lentisphaeria bacterium]|nr:hypothetical protein [Lentisphaeria bacterium]